MRPILLILLAALLGVALVPYPQAPAGASCAGPMLVGQHPGRDDPVVLAHGRESVEVEHLVDGCQDTMSCGVGCSGCEYDEPAPRPRRHVRLELRQAGRSWPLGAEDADPEGRARWDFRLPKQVGAGRARLLLDGMPLAVVRVR